MSFPFESRSHAQLRRRLLAAMGLLPACVSEPGLIDASEPDDEMGSGACCGRPFVVQGKARLARAMRRSDWLAILPELGGKSLPMPLRERAAAEWLEDARMEHASVAAFARFTLELLAFAAPSDLVMESQLAGLDEVEHARLCFGLASRYAGAQLGPSTLTMGHVAPAASLRESVLSAVLEGCIGETLAAARASAALEGTREQAARTVLAKIAEDESRHAELAYRYVAWALTREPSLASDIHELVRRESSSLSTKSQG